MEFKIDVSDSQVYKSLKLGNTISVPTLIIIFKSGLIIPILLIMNNLTAKIQELVNQYGYDAQVLTDFAVYVQTLPKKKAKKKKEELTIPQLKKAIFDAFGCKNYQELKNNKAFKLATDSRDFNFRTKEPWLILYREWVGVPNNEQYEEGATCINGLDVLKNFRPWHVFNLDPKIATKDDINGAFKELAKKHHPDVGGDREVFERLKKMRDSILAFR